MADHDFGSHRPGEYADREITLKAAGATRFVEAIEGEGFTIESSSPVFEPHDDTVRRVGSTFRVRFTATSDSPVGPATGTLRLNDVSTSLQAAVYHFLEVTTPPLLVGAVGSALSGIVQVDNRTSQDATIALRGAVGFALSAGSVPPSTGPVNLTITFTPAAAELYTDSIVASAASQHATADVAARGIVPGTTTTYGGAADQLEAAWHDEDMDGAVDEGEVRTTYKVHVPSAVTRMHLGAAVDPFPNLDGFGLRTSGKGLLHASGNIGVRSVEGDVRVQADAANVVTVSGGNTIIAAKGGSYLIGDGGVLVSTALDVDPQTGDDGIPEPGNMTAASNAASGVFAALDGMIAAASFIRVAKSRPWRGWKDFTPRAKVGVGMAAVSGGAAFTCAMLGGFSVANASGASYSVPGVTVYGHAGVLIGTPGFGSFYAAAGMVLGSIFPLLLGVDTEVLGMRSVALTGLDATITGWKGVSIEGAEGVKAASGKTINIAVRPEKTDTSAVAMEDGKIAVTADESLSIQIGKYLVTVDQSSGIQIGWDSNGEVDAQKSRIWLDETSAYVNGPGGKSWVQVEDTMAMINGGSSKAKSGQIQLKDDLAKIWAGQQSMAIDGQGNINLKAKQIITDGKVGLTFKGKQIKIG